MMLKTQGEVPEDEILQTVDAVKDFIALSVNRRFDALRKTRSLPDEKDALARLAIGDASYSLGLLEALMDSNINAIAKTTSEQKREALIKETSFAAIMFGNLANLSDTRLATESFELAIDLSPNNVNAWGRLADMYYKISEHQKAIESYKKLLALSDEEVYPRQVANAHQKLALYYFEQGDTSNATKLYDSSKKYYDYIGINKDLESQELEIIEIIESRQKEELQNAITRIFNSKKWQLSCA
jgi:tetratricopeptide (TPR) repeat protein